MRAANLIIAWAGLALLLAGCPGHGVDKDTTGDEQPAADAGAGPDGGAAAAEVEVVGRPTFDPDKPPPCESHTACYLAAKEAHTSGKRAGYLLALESCEFYRGRYQLEKFYGMCLLILADCYRHLNNFEEAENCYRRFLDTQPDDQALALQAREGMEEVEAGKDEPDLYRRYLEAVSLLTRFNNESDDTLVEKARQLLESIQTAQPGWALAEKVKFLLGRIAGLKPSEPELQPSVEDGDEAPPAEDTAPGGENN